MAVGNFYVATSGPTSSSISSLTCRPVLLDGFALVVREPQMAALLMQQVRGWEDRIFPARLLTRYAVPPIPANVDGMLVHPSQVESDPRSLSLYFFPEENLCPSDQEFLARSQTRRFLTLGNRLVPRTPEQSWVERALLPENSSVMEELLRMLPPSSGPSSMTEAFRELMREYPPISQPPQPEKIADLRARRVRRRK